LPPPSMATFVPQMFWKRKVEFVWNQPRRPSVGRHRRAGSPKETDMDAQAIKAELLKCERDYWQSIKDQNPEAARRLTDFPCIIAGAQGVATMDEKTFGAMMNGGPSQLRDFK